MSGHSAPDAVKETESRGLTGGAHNPTSVRRVLKRLLSWKAFCTNLRHQRKSACYRQFSWQDEENATENKAAPLQTQSSPTWCRFRCERHRLQRREAGAGHGRSLTAPREHRLSPTGGPSDATALLAPLTAEDDCVTWGFRGKASHSLGGAGHGCPCALGSPEASGFHPTEYTTCSSPALAQQQADSLDLVPVPTVCLISLSVLLPRDPGTVRHFSCLLSHRVDASFLYSSPNVVSLLNVSYI